MTKKEQLVQTYCYRTESLHSQLDEQIQETINFAFSVQDEYAIPSWLWTAMDAMGAVPCQIWLDYNHEGVWAVPYAISKVHDNLYFDGIENEEYSQSRTYSNIVFPSYEIVQFIQWFVEVFEPELEDLKTRLSIVHRMGDIDIVIEEWCNEYCYDFEFIETEEVIRWMNEELNK